MFDRLVRVGGIDVVRKELTLIALVALSAGAPPCVAEDAPRLPSIALLSSRPTLDVPTGLPMVPDFVPHIPGRRAASARSSDPAGARNQIGTKAADRLKAKEEEDDDDDDDNPLPPARPGTLQTNFVKVPMAVPVLKNRSLGPHLKPDATLDLNDRTTVGIISQLDGLRASTVMSTLGRSQLLPPSLRPTTTTTSPHSLRSRDLGLGATLEFKLGQ